MNSPKVDVFSSVTSWSWFPTLRSRTVGYGGNRADGRVGARMCEVQAAMFSDELARRLSAMPLRADAERRISYMPLGSIYWTDELNERIDDLFEDGNEGRLAPLLRLFAIRGALWTGLELSAADLAFWEAARSKAPDYALFQRLQVSDEDAEMYRDVANTARSFWRDFFKEEREAAARAEEAELLSELDIVEVPLAVE